jgi:hypothetical protein
MEPPVTSPRSRTRPARAAWTAAVGLGVWISCALPFAQTEFGATEIAEYQLRAEVFVRFDRASHAIAEATRSDTRFQHAPLFTEEILLSGDILPMAVALEARLRNDPALAGALETAGITPHEYTKFVLALVGARLAHGFMKSGVLKSVPPGAPSHNVTFVDTNLPQVEAVLKDLGVE